MKRIIIISLIIIALVVASVSIFKNIAAEVLIEKQVELITGLHVAVEEVVLYIFKSNITVKELLIANPKDFKERVMINVPEVCIYFHPITFFKKGFYLKELKLDIAEISIIKNKEGKLNLGYLTVIKAQKKGKKPVDIIEEETPKIHIDNLWLKIKKVVYKDYSQGSIPFIIELDIDINETFQNIENPYSLIRIVLTEAIKKAALRQYINIGLETLSKPIAKVLSTAKQMSGIAVVAAQKAIKQNGEAVKNAQNE